MTPVAGHAPGAGRLRPRPTGHGSRGGDHLFRRVGDRHQLRAGRAAAGLLRQVGRAHLPAAVPARRSMLRAGTLAAHGTLLHLIGREECHCLLGAARPMPRAHQAPRLVGAAQVPRAVHLPIHRAHRLMRRAHRLAAARAFSNLVHADRLVGAALTVLEARRTQTPASLRRIRATLLRVPVAYTPAAAAAGREAGRARGMPILGADTLVGRAVLQAARRTDAHVLVARWLLVDATLGDAVVSAEVLGADRAASRARLTATVVVLADYHGRWLAA